MNDKIIHIPKNCFQLKYFKHLFDFKLCVCVLHVCLCVCLGGDGYVHMSADAQGRVRTPGSGITSGCEPLRIPDPLQEQYTLYH